MKTRKFTLPTPLLKLTDDQLAEVHSWFKRSTYPEILARLRERFGVEMSKTQLCRYYQRFAEANLFNAVLHTPLTPADMLAIQNADPISDEINCAVLNRHCIRLQKPENHRHRSHATSPGSHLRPTPRNEGARADSSPQTTRLSRQLSGVPPPTPLPPAIRPPDP